MSGLSQTTLLIAATCMNFIIGITGIALSIVVARRSRDQRRLLSPRTDEWASKKLVLGDDLLHVIGKYVSDPTSLPTTGFYLFLSDASLLEACEQSLATVCRRWHHDYRLVAEGPSSILKPSNSVMRTIAKLQSDFELPAVAVLFFRNGRLMDSAPHVYLPRALENRFSMVAG